MSLDLLSLVLGAVLAVLGISFSGISYFGETHRQIENRRTLTRLGLVAAVLFVATLVSGVSREIVQNEIQTEDRRKLAEAATSINEAVAWLRNQPTFASVAVADSSSVANKTRSFSAPDEMSAAALLEKLEATRVRLSKEHK